MKYKVQHEIKADKLEWELNTNSAKGYFPLFVILAQTGEFTVVFQQTKTRARGE